MGPSSFDDAAPPVDRLAELEKTLALIGLDAETIAPLVAPVVDVPLPPDRVPKLDPDELLRRQLEAGESWTLAGARTQPAVLAFEDLQWFNSASLALLASRADSGAQAPLFVVGTARPEFRAPWPLRAHHALLALAPLDPPEVRLMVRALASPRELSKDDDVVVSQPAKRRRASLRRGSHAAVSQARRTRPASWRSLRRSSSRWRRGLGEAREIAEIGAVLGRVFDYALLRDVADLPEAALQASLERLCEAGILIPKCSPPDSAYRFKHALIRDAAYENLLRSRRQTLHLRAAELLRDPDRAIPAPDAIARHIAWAEKAAKEIDEDAED